MAVEKHFKLDYHLNMGSKFPLLVLVTTFILILGGVLLMSGDKTEIPLPANHEYYWSETCPHCKNVQEFINGWDKKDKLTLEKYEISDRNNSVKMSQRADYCRLPRTQLGVPFLFSPDGKCISGDEPIIEYLKNLEL